MLDEGRPAVVAVREGFVRRKDFLIGIDSDGCVFDNMAVKHRECFCPAFVERFGLGEVAEAAFETWEFVNLRSHTRGQNRFQALLRFVELLRARPEAAAVRVPSLRSLAKWIERSPQLSNDALEAACERSGDEELERVLAWSKAVNASIRRRVTGFAAFASARSALAKAAAIADVVVVSQTPAEAIRREWAQAGIDEYASFVAGQEFGSKEAAIADLAGSSRYAKDRVLMIGDAPGDELAARGNGALFFPIVPGREEESWALFEEEGLGRFAGGSYAGSFEARLVREFSEALPERAQWEDT